MTQGARSYWRDLKVYDNRMYVVAEIPNHGMQVFDLTTLRTRTLITPEEAASNMADIPQLVPTEEYNLVTSRHNIAMSEFGFAYAHLAV